jgi:CBS-domain-containing membrane protein
MLDTTPRLSWRQRLLVWRARLSIPSLLAGCDERRVVSVLAAVHAGAAILIISVLAWLLDLPLLFPALGPSAFILFSSPFSAAAAPRSVVVGHFVAMAAGLAVWSAVTFVGGQPVSLPDGGWPVFVSASLALAAACALLVRLNCPHAPACATALIIALGAATSWLDLLGMAAGVLLLTTQAVWLNRAAGVRTPHWSPQISPEMLR